MPTPASSEGGGTFNGGGISNGLNIDPAVAATTTQPLHVTDETIKTGNVVTFEDENSSIVFNLGTTGGRLGGSSSLPAEVNVTAAAGVKLYGDSDADSGPGIQVNDGPTLGFFNTTPAARPAAIANAAGGAIIDAEARAALNSALAALRTLGLIAT